MAGNGRSPSRRALLGALASMPIASIPIPQIGVSSLEWATALARFDAAIVALGPVAKIFNAAEDAYFSLSEAGASNREQRSAAKAALRKATRDHNRCLDAVCDALDALLDTRAPDLATLISKIEIVMKMRGPDFEEGPLDHVLADLRALQPGVNFSGGSA